MSNIFSFKASSATATDQLLVARVSNGIETTVRVSAGYD